MEPKIRYARSADGVNIAYWAIGEGRPLVYMPPMPWCHIEREWAIPEWRRRYERLAAGRRLVRYDARGFGLSDPSPTGVTPAAHAGDLEAVLDALAIDECDLFAPADAGFAAIEFCARAAERVGRLVFWGSYANRDRLLSDPKVTSLHALWDEDWFQYTELAIRTILGWKHGDRAEQLAEFYRAAATRESVPNVIGALYGIDLTSLLPRVDVPTLVVALEDCWVDVQEEARSLAAGLPNAELRTVHGETIYFDFFDDEDAVVTVVNEFLGGPALQQARADDDRSPAPTGMTAILFLDIVDSTALTSKLGDAAYRERERSLDASLRAAITEAGGTPVEGKVLGDGVMAVFTSARQAIDAAQRCRDLGNDAGLPLRLGIHAGDVVREGNNVHGGAVQLASRVQSVAAPGEILVSATVRDLARTSAGVAFEDRGEHELKGIAEPQRLFAVREQG